jgi:acetyl esterase/lipase
LDPIWPGPHLIYLMLDDTQTTVSSQGEGLAVWSQEMNAFGWQCYLRGSLQRRQCSCYAAPARASDLSSSAPAYVHVGTVDGFLREDISYPARLLGAGVPAELHAFPGAPRGFDGIASAAAVAKAATALSEAALKRGLS